MGGIRKVAFGGIKITTALCIWFVLMGTNIPVKVIGKDLNLKTITNLPQFKNITLFGGNPVEFIKGFAETEEMKQKIEENADAIIDAIGGLQAVQRFKPDPQTGRTEVIITLKEFPFAKFLLSQGAPGKGLTPELRERLGKAFKDKYVEKLRRDHERLVEEIYRIELNYARARGKKEEDVWRTKILKEYFIGLNGIYTEVTPEIIPLIKKLGYVENVYENRRLEPLLIDSIPLIQADYAHSLGFKGGGITVGIIDTGINRFHPDLLNNIWHNTCEIPGDGIDNDGNCPGDTNGDGIRCGAGDAGVDDDWGWDFVGDDKEPMDEQFHGTHVAGIVAGNGEVVKGVAPEARVISYRVCGGDGCFYDDILMALDIAMVQFSSDCNKGSPQILNMSLGGPGVSCENDPNDFSCDPLVSSVNTAADTGILVVVAGGNNGNGNYFTLNSSPAVAEKALTVGATDKQDNLAQFSAFGPSAHKAHIKPEIVAPGVSICSAWAGEAPPPQFFESCVDDRHVKLSGTSMATPHVAGAGAVLIGAIKQKYGENLSADEAKALLVETGNILSPGGVEASIFKQGGGRLNLKKTIDSGVVITPGVLNLGQASFAKNPDYWLTSLPLVVHNFSDQDIILQLTYQSPNGIAVNIPSSVTVKKKGYEGISAVFTLYSWAPPPVDSPLYEGKIVASYILNGESQTLHVPFAIIPAPIMVTFTSSYCPLLIHVHNRKDLRVDYYPPVPCENNPNYYCLYDMSPFGFRIRQGIYDFIIVGVDKINPAGSCSQDNLDLEGNIYFLVKDNHEVVINKPNLFNFGEANKRIYFLLKNHNGDDIFTALKGVSINLAFLFERDNPPQPGPTYPDSATPYGSLYLGPFNVTADRLQKLYFSNVTTDYNIDFMFKASDWVPLSDGKVKTTNELIKASFDGLTKNIFYENCTTPDDCASKFHVTTKFGYRNTDKEGCFLSGGPPVWTLKCHANAYMPFTGRHELSPWAPFVWFVPQYFMNWMGTNEPINANPSKYNDYTITLYQMVSANNFAFRDIEFEVWGVDMYGVCWGFLGCSGCIAFPIIQMYPYTISPYFATETTASMKGYLPDLAEVHEVKSGYPYLMNLGHDIPFVKFNNEPTKININAPLGKYNLHFVNQNGEFDEPAMDTEVYLDGQLVFSEYNVLASSYWYDPPRTIDLPATGRVTYKMGISTRQGSVDLDNLKLTAEFNTEVIQPDKNPPYIKSIDFLSDEGFPVDEFRAGEKRIIRFELRDDETGISDVKLFYRPACPPSQTWVERPWEGLTLNYEGNGIYSGEVPFRIDPTWASDCSGINPMPDGSQWMWTWAEIKIKAEDNSYPTHNSITLELTGEYGGFIYKVPYDVESYPLNIQRDGFGGVVAGYTFDTNTKVWSTSYTNGVQLCNCSSSELRDVTGVYLRDFPVYLPDYDTWVNFLNYMFYWGWNVYSANTITFPTQYYAIPPWQDVPVYNVQLLSQPDGSIMLRDPVRWKALPSPEELGSLEVCLGPERRQIAEQMLLNPAPYFWYGHFEAAPSPQECVCKPRLMEWLAPNLENFVYQEAFVAFLPEYDPPGNEQRIIPLISEIDEQGRIILKQGFEVR